MRRRIEFVIVASDGDNQGQAKSHSRHLISERGRIHGKFFQANRVIQQVHIAVPVQVGAEAACRNFPGDV